MRIIKILLILIFAAVAVLYTMGSVSLHLRDSSQPPAISFALDTLEVSAADDERALLIGVTASDAQDGNLTSSVIVSGVSKLISDNTAKVTYVVFDSDNNMASATRLIRYTDYSLPRFSLEEPLIYSANEDISLLDRLHATDAIDGDITGSIRVSSLTATSDAEIYTVSVQVTNSMGDTAWQTLPVIITEGTAQRPVVTLTTYLDYVSQGSTFRPRDYLLKVETIAGRGTLADVRITGTVDTDTPGTYMVHYTYTYGTVTGTTVLTVVVE